MAEEDIRLEPQAFSQQQPGEPQQSPQLTGCRCIVGAKAGEGEPFVLQQPGYKLPLAAGKMHLMPPGGHFTGKMHKKMHMRRVTNVNEDSQSLSKDVLIIRVFLHDSVTLREVFDKPNHKSCHVNLGFHKFLQITLYF